jgi:tetratricopeptide (TPR) repeat protein
MRRLKVNRWTLVVPAMLAAGAAITLSGQSPEKSLIEPSSLTVPTLPSNANQPTPEQEGDSLAARQRYQAAIAAYSKSPQMTAAIWNKMGIAYQMMFNSKDATRCYKESLKLEPHNPQVLNNLGTVYASMKEYGQADRLYRKALKLDPRNAAILKNLGTDLLSEKRYDKGWEAYQQAIAIDPQIFADHNNPKVANPATVQERGAMNYYMALGCARSGYTDCALEYLRAALDEGFTSRKKVANDAQFASLRANPAFQRLMAEPSVQ